MRGGGKPCGDKSSVRDRVIPRRLSVGTIDGAITSARRRIEYAVKV